VTLSITYVDADYVTWDIMISEKQSHAHAMASLQFILYTAGFNEVLMVSNHRPLALRLIALTLLL